MTRRADVEMALRETHGGESRTTRGDICRSLAAGNELFIDPQNKLKSRGKTERAEHRSRKRNAEFSTKKINKERQVGVDKDCRRKGGGGRIPILVPISHDYAATITMGVDHAVP
jgi:hypothetical protein